MRSNPADIGFSRGSGSERCTCSSTRRWRDMRGRFFGAVANTESGRYDSIIFYPSRTLRFIDITQQFGTIVVSARPSSAVRSLA